MKYSYDFRKIARESLKGKWGLALAVGLVASLLGGTDTADGLININLPSEELVSQSYSIVQIFGILTVLFSLFAAVFTVVIGGVTELGYKKFNLKLVKNENPQFENLFDYFKYIKKGVAMVLLRGIFTFLWTLLFIIPGIVATYRYALIPYILADNPEMPAMEALELSKKMMHGNKARLFGLHLTFTGWNILAFLTFGIGFLWLIPYMSAAEAAFYEDLKSGSDQKTYSDTSDKKADFDHINWDE